MTTGPAPHQEEGGPQGGMVTASDSEHPALAGVGLPRQQRRPTAVLLVLAPAGVGGGGAGVPTVPDSSPSVP